MAKKKQIRSLADLKAAIKRGDDISLGQYVQLLNVKQKVTLYKAFEKHPSKDIGVVIREGIDLVCKKILKK